MIVTFCDSLGWTHLRACLSGLAERLMFGVRSDVAHLVRIDGVDGMRARAFHTHGYKTIASVARANLKDVINVLHRAVPFKSGAMLSQDNCQSLKVGKIILK